MKNCSRCNQYLTLTEFTKHKGMTDGLKTICKSCTKILITTYRLENKDKIKKTKSTYDKNHLAEARARKRRYAVENKEHIKEITHIYQEKNKERIKIRQREYVAKNKDRVAFVKKEYELKHRDEIIAKRKIYYNANIDKMREKDRRYGQQNPDKINAKTGKRRAAKLQRTPPWLTKEHFKQIRAFYKEASRLTKETGIRYSVDHQVPLQGKTVSGLHVPWNLQVIPFSENSSKNNKF